MTKKYRILERNDGKFLIETKVGDDGAWERVLHHVLSTTGSPYHYNKKFNNKVAAKEWIDEDCSFSVSLEIKNIEEYP